MEIGSPASLPQTRFMPQAEIPRRHWVWQTIAVAAAPLPFVRLRIPGLVLSDLVAKKRMDRSQGLWIFRVDPYGAALRQIFIAVRDLLMALLHLGYARGTFPVRVEGLVEVSTCEIAGDGPQMTADRRDHGFVLFVLDVDLDRAAGRSQLDMMRRRILIEAHRLGAALLQRLVSFHLLEVLVVGHALRHGRMLSRQQQGRGED